MVSPRIKWSPEKFELRISEGGVRVRFYSKKNWRDRVCKIGFFKVDTSAFPAFQALIS